MPILEFEALTLAPGPRRQAGIEALSLRLMPGDWALVRLEAGREKPPLADLACGLAVPDAGRAIFLGRAWSDCAPEDILRRQALIGRVFAEHGWVSNLTIAENVTLGQRHHTRRPLNDNLEEARALALRFGLPDLPAARPARVPRHEARRAEWIRAFLGQPRLILLEHPMQGVPAACFEPLLDAAREACARGAAVLWLADRDEAAQPPAGYAAQRFLLNGPTLASDDAGPGAPVAGGAPAARPHPAETPP